MALVTVARFQEITGDTTTSSSDVEDAIATATGLLEGTLGRELEEDEYTERLPVFYRHSFIGGRVYPRVTPIVEADEDYEILSDTILTGVSPDSSPLLVGTDTYATVTYTGGYLERTATANAEAENKLPLYVERDIAWAAYTQIHDTSTSLVPVGATSVRVGDVAVSYKGSTGARDDSLAQWSKSTLRLKRRRL